MTIDTALQIPGVVKGKSIELERETGLPVGSQVIVNISPVPLTLSEKLQLADELYGAWADDSSIKQIFAEIEQERNSVTAREIDFDAPS